MAAVFPLTQLQLGRFAPKLLYPSPRGGEGDHQLKPQSVYVG